MREKKQVKQFERLFRPVEWNTTCGERGDGNYEWWWSEVLLHPLKKMSSMRDDWNPPGLTCLSECLQLNRKTHKTHKKRRFWGHFVPCATSNWNIKIEERFPQRSPCPLSHKSNLKSEAEPLIHISVTLAGPHSGPQPSNNIHCFLPLKKEHPLHSILDVGGQIFGLKTRGSRLITTVPLSAKSASFLPTS